MGEKINSPSPAPVCWVAEAQCRVGPQQAAQRYLESGGYFLLDLFNSFEVS